MYSNRFLFLLGVLVCFNTSMAGDDFRVVPYLQNPSSSAMTLLWFSESNLPGELVYHEDGSRRQNRISSQPEPAVALKYSTWEDTSFFKGRAPAIPYRHRIRLEGLKPATKYIYSVSQGGSVFDASFNTAPDEAVPVRFIVYADSETEPESTGKYALWEAPQGNSSRRYLIDQTQGYRNNLEVIQSRHPDLILIAGDLVQHGGEQRDWDEFWRHNTNRQGGTSLASQIPIIAALGNHDYYEGNALGRYNQPGSERAVNKYLNYFESPTNDAANRAQEGRYYSLEYGPASLIVVDLCNNSPSKSEYDTNFFLLGESDQEGGNAPDFHPGSRQYRWLEIQLQKAQLKSLFTFVVFHHAPYSSGPHGWAPGRGNQLDPQSGTATRALTPLFMRYGVDAVFNGHDEMWERSELSGQELELDGELHDHSIQFYDVGVGGDGLRAPIEGLENPFQQFLAHTDSPEEWQDNVLLDGGKHYGHLEVDINKIDERTWQAVLKPVYIFPLMGPDGKTYSGYSRRLYKDKVTLIRSTY